jgi:hypothetical protein
LTNDGELKGSEEAKRRILEENLHITKDSLEFILSLPIERKIPKVRYFFVYWPVEFAYAY